MMTYLILSVGLTALACFGVYRLFQQQVLEQYMTLDDAKGFFLIGSILLGFIASAISFYIGSLMGYSAQEESSTVMALTVLLDVMAALLVLIWGLVKLREPEVY